MVFLTLSLGLVLAHQSQIQDLGAVGYHDTRGTLDDGTGVYWVHGEKMEQPHLCPGKVGNPPSRLEFGYSTDAYANIDPKSHLSDHRFRVFSQTPERNEHLGKSTAFELLVLWAMLRDHLHLDHKKLYEGGLVDVYLCEGGDPGGEQAIEPVPNSTAELQANSIYIYDVAHFDDKMEQAREVAHEYGHAVIPPVGGFDGRDGAEYWANGNLGEKLFLRWGRDGLVGGYLQEECFMHTPKVMLMYWVNQHVDPLVKAAAARPPDSPLYRGTNRAAFDAYQGIVLWCDTIMPRAMFGRSMNLIGSEKAQDYVVSAVQAAEEATYSPNIPHGDPKAPTYPAGFSAAAGVWIPVGKGSVTGANVIEKKLGWWLVKPTGKVVVHKKPESN